MTSVTDKSLEKPTTQNQVDTTKSSSVESSLFQQTVQGSISSSLNPTKIHNTDRSSIDNSFDTGEEKKQESINKMKSSVKGDKIKAEMQKLSELLLRADNRQIKRLKEISGEFKSFFEDFQAGSHFKFQKDAIYALSEITSSGSEKQKIQLSLIDMEKFRHILFPLTEASWALILVGLVLEKTGAKSELSEYQSKIYSILNRDLQIFLKDYLNTREKAVTYSVVSKKDKYIIYRNDLTDPNKTVEICPIETDSIIQILNTVI